ncbi:MAG TPA: hypothetical protein VLM79_29590 [Kofleriaceae bacterium]|nr:hypothetical protein [Kofleriaceae bacterium]
MRFAAAVGALCVGCAGDVSSGWSPAAGHAQPQVQSAAPHRPMCPPAARRTLSGRGTAIVDGVLGAGEWRQAASIAFHAQLPGGGTAPAELFVMNDDANLYVAVRFARPVVDPGNSLGLELDNDDDCARANGDDAVVMNPAVGLFDDFRTNAPPCPPGSATAACAPRDDDAGGKNDGKGAFVHDGGFTVYELSHPLHSGDTGHDIDLRAGDSVGMYLSLRMIGAAGAIGDTTFPDDGFLEIKTRPAPGPCVPSAGPKPLGWTDGRYFPSFPKAQRLFVLPAMTQLHDHDAAWKASWRISDSPDTMNALTLVGMQGVINRDTPCVYLDWFDPATGPSGTGGASAFWLSELAQDVTLDQVDAAGGAAIDFLYRRFSERFTGAVVYDPAIPDTINLATMIAGLEDRIILAPQQLGQPGVPGLADVTDLRALAASQGWDTTDDGKHELYRWAYDHLYPRLEHRLIGVVSPGPPTSRAIPGTPNANPLGLAGRDYLVALRAPALWLSPVDPPDSELFGKFLDGAPPGTPVSGFFANDEEATVALASRHDDWVPVIHIANAPLSAGNLTALAGAREPISRTAAAIDPERILATLGDAPVTTLFSSDGDSVQFQADRGFWGPIGFPWPEVQGHRFAWTTNPTLVDLAPVIWNYYAESAQQVSLIDSLSGAGYVYPQQMTAPGLKRYLQHTADYNRRTGVRVVQIDTRKGPYESVGAEYHNQLRRSGYLGAFAGGGTPVLGLPAVYAGVPSPGVAPAYVVPGLPSPEAVLADLPGRRLGNATLRLFDWPSLLNGVGTVIADPSAPGGKAVQYLASQTQCCLAFTSTAQRLLPGTYTVSFTLKVADHRSPDQIATIYALAGGPDPLARRAINASDFTQAGQWQTFSFTFTLPAQTAGVALQLDFLPHVSDLFASQMRLVRDGADPLPVFAPIFIVLTAPGPKRDAARLGEQLAAAGVVVLTADEFMAALNPEFMIGFAAPRLGANHPALKQARAQLKANQFLEALITVRTALAAARR